MTSEISSFLNDLAEDTQPIPQVYSKKTLSNKTINKILKYQKNHILRLIRILVQKSIALDGSDTGVGKTYIAIAICVEMGRRPIIVCPKTLIYNWISVCEFFGVKPYDVVNYETIRNGKSYADSNFTSRVTSPFISVNEHDPENKTQDMFEWSLPDDAMLIFDEAHRCKSTNTDNGKLLISTKQAIYQKIPVLLASATISQKATDMRVPFYLFDIIPSVRRFNAYVKTLEAKHPQYRVHKYKYDSKEKYKNAKERAISIIINAEIKDHTSRIRIKDIGEKFPQNQLSAQQFTADSAEVISDAYSEIQVLMDELKQKGERHTHHLARIQKLKQMIELRKIPIFLEQAQLHLDNGKSVIIFVNFLDTLHLLASKLHINCQIYGDQTLKERTEAIRLFQSNQERIIICQIRAGGVGINLNDTDGNYPRAVLVNYPDSGSDLLQALGRAVRAGTKSPVLQRIIFVANVEYEKTVMQNINRKLENISATNDGVLDGYKYKIKK